MPAHGHTHTHTVRTHTRDRKHTHHPLLQSRERAERGPPSGMRGVRAPSPQPPNMARVASQLPLDSPPTCPLPLNDFGWGRCVTVCVCRGVFVYQSLSCVQLFATPWDETCQAPLSMEFSRPEYWSG